MLRHLKENWEQIKQGTPGRRFRDTYEGQQQRGASGMVRPLALAAGSILILVGLILVPAPGPGWAIVILGLALLSTVWHPVARLLDWIEPRFHSGWERLKAWWKQKSF